jgi:uncharacterized coiled-coil protein SlyX
VDIEQQLNEQLKQQFDQRLAEQLTEERACNDELLEKMREQLTAKYDGKAAQLKNQLAEKSESETKLRSQLLSLQTKFDSVSSEAIDHEAQNRTLKKKIKDMEGLLSQEREWHSMALADKERELDSLREQLAQNLKEYEELLGVKIQLDNEIGTYRRLLEGEETRLD